jgi:hypothetical protein
MLLGDLSHPFYKPAWRRVAIVATTVVWFGFEALVAKSMIWAILSGALCLYCAYAFLYAWKDAPPAPPE